MHLNLFCFALLLALGSVAAASGNLRGPASLQDPASSQQHQAHRQLLDCKGKDKNKKPCRDMKKGAGADDNAADTNNDNSASASASASVSTDDPPSASRRRRRRSRSQQQQHDPNDEADHKMVAKPIYHKNHGTDLAPNSLNRAVNKHTREKREYRRSHDTRKQVHVRDKRAKKKKFNAPGNLRDELRKKKQRDEAAARATFDRDVDTEAYMRGKQHIKKRKRSMGLPEYSDESSDESDSDEDSDSSNDSDAGNSDDRAQGLKQKQLAKEKKEKEKEAKRKEQERLREQLKAEEPKIREQARKEVEKEMQGQLNQVLRMINDQYQKDLRGINNLDSLRLNDIQSKYSQEQ